MYHFKRIALTGATSTIGVAIIEECIKHNIEVLAFVNRGSKNIDRIPEHILITKMECSLEEMVSFDVSKLSAEVFIHLAWQSTNRLERNVPYPQIDNVKYSVDAVYLANRLQCSIYIGAGSQAEYGLHEEVISEDSITRPVTAYGIAKLCAGQMTRLACRELGMRHIWPRIFSTYGPNTQDSTIINYTIRSLLRGERPSLTKCEQIWDFLYVEDAAKALLLLAEKGEDGEIYNVASGQAKCMRSFIEEIRYQIGEDIEIGYGDLPYGDNTVMHLEGDVSKLKCVIDFSSTVNFCEGIESTIAWARDYY